MSLLQKTPTNYRLQTQFFKDVDLHMRVLCNGALKDESNIFLTADRVMRRIKYIIDSQIDNRIGAKTEMKFKEYLGVRENVNHILRKDSLGNPILDEEGKPISDTYVTYAKVGKAHLLRSAMQEIMADYSKDIEEDIESFFKKKMREEDAVQKFVGEIISNATSDLHRRLHQQSRSVFAIKTGEFHRYSSPPMGNNEFIRKIVDNDILRLGEEKEVGDENGK